MASLHIFITLVLLALVNISQEKPMNQVAKRDAMTELAGLDGGFVEATKGELVEVRVKRSPAPQMEDSSEESAESEESEESEESIEGSADGSSEEE
eukprot:TRINITY_DN9241_c0_g1_i1.p1 TRINITY_DN9241_c0_g1~~TRINITY_DN9241_c0_g1_i1.p1  ORF type:complete len:108 (-),score=39.34 TRINITY_DN9241_c0_g1_i1:225-512(-)